MTDRNYRDVEVQERHRARLQKSRKKKLLEQKHNERRRIKRRINNGRKRRHARFKAEEIVYDKFKKESDRREEIYNKMLDNGTFIQSVI